MFEQVILKGQTLQRVLLEIERPSGRSLMPLQQAVPEAGMSDVPRGWNLVREYLGIKFSFAFDQRKYSHNTHWYPCEQFMRMRNSYLV